MIKQKAIEAIHNLGGCDASDEWSKGYDAGITAALNAIEELPDTDIRHGTWSDQKLFDDGFGDGRVGYICSACGKYVHDGCEKCIQEWLNEDFSTDFSRNCYNSTV